jgi:hypothetical protein
MHPRWPRCSSLKYSRYSRSSRLAIEAPRPSRCDARRSPRAVKDRFSIEERGRLALTRSRRRRGQQLLDDVNPGRELRSRRRQLVCVLVACPAQSGSGIRHALGEIVPALEMRRQTQQLRAGRTSFESWRPAAPQIVERAFERLTRKQYGRTRPDPGRVWVRPHPGEHPVLITSDAADFLV